MTESTLGEFDDSATIYKATGPPDHWITTLNTGIWGFTTDNENGWERLDEGDIVLFHSTGKDTHDGRWDSGVVGYGVAGPKRRKERPLWRTEVEAGENQYPFVVDLVGTYWRGDVDDVSSAPVGGKSAGRLDGDIEAMLRNRLTLARTKEATGDRFPVMGSFNEPSHGETYLELLHEEPLTAVRYRHREEPSTEDGAEQPPDFAPLLEGDIEVPADGLLDGLHFPEGERERIRSATVSAVRSGKHVVFTGPPGTGKTELAENLCRALQVNEQYTGYRLTTATADWSTFDTVGGYMPREEAGGSLEFKPGQVLKRLPTAGAARNELLVVDEINRADIDKAFGQLFTVLSGQAVQLPFETDGTEIEIVPGDDVDPATGPASYEYAVPSSWRLFATMNSYDKTSLYEMSYAFMRRFAFVRVGAPTLPEDDEALEELLAAYDRAWGNDGSDRPERLAVGRVWRAINAATEERAIGPAIVKDVLEFVRTQPAAVGDTAFDRHLTEAVLSYVFPQLEGVPKRGRIVEAVAKIDRIDETRLFESAREMLQVELAADG
jgi:5-methylcytosine-specific restriction protein B